MSIRAATETTNLGRYHVVKRLAKGGMADVLLARTEGVAGFERHVVIKRIHPELGDEPRYRKMFLDEARLAASLHHHNIVQVNDIGEQSGEYFFAMEYVHGEDARTLLINATDKGETIPIEHVITIVMAAASGLHHAHDQKGADKKPLHIVHRDVSPANILVGYDGGVKVADFGIAFAANRAEQTQSGVLKGKASYMSPEQCNCEPVDRRSDVFSLGICLYELCTVNPCFRGDNDFMTMKAIVGGIYERPSKLNAAIPPELEAIIVKAMSNRPDDRYATCDEMRLALETFAEAQNMRTSTTALADYMKQQFGTRPEPWLEEATPDEAEIEITGSSPLDLVLELKLPDAEPEDDLAIPVETTAQGMVPIAKPPDGVAPIAPIIPIKSWNRVFSRGRTKTPPAGTRPVKETLPLRALKIAPAPRAATPPVVPAVMFPEDEEPEVQRRPTTAPEMLARLLMIKRVWLVASAGLLVIALVLFIVVVTRGGNASATKAPSFTPHEDLEPRIELKQRSSAPIAPRAVPAPAKPAVVPAKKAPEKKWDPDALFPN
ncbi:MAG TPA: serine/threonine-protein kinase [Kofleriaceae bacterium]|nr:serine/threonine-protein kinase [Kofleriaceae bacterium]